MKIADIRKLDDAKLQENLLELKAKVRELRFSITNNQLKNLREIRKAKKSIAKILTALKEKSKTDQAA